MKTELTAFAAVIALFLAVLPTDANAYIDPGTGSMIIQVILAAFLGAIVTCKQWWGVLKAKLSGKPSSPPQDEIKGTVADDEHNG